MTRMRARRPSACPTQYVLAVGTLEPRKGLDALIAAMGRPEAPDIPLLIAGPDGWGDVSVERLRDEAGLSEDRVRALGRLSDEDLAVAMRRATVFVFPSRAEGFGLPVVEAFALGTPVIHSDAPALLEISADAGLAVPLDEDAARSTPSASPRRSRASSATTTCAARCAPSARTARARSAGPRPPRRSGSCTPTCDVSAPHSRRASSGEACRVVLAALAFGRGRGDHQRVGHDLVDVVVVRGIHCDERRCELDVGDVELPGLLGRARRIGRASPCGMSVRTTCADAAAIAWNFDSTLAGSNCRRIASCTWRWRSIRS